MTEMTQIAEAFQDAVTEKLDQNLEPVLRAMARMAEESVRASESMEEFCAAQAEAREKNIGVVVVRRADGTTTSTPNVFVPRGTAIFMDEPGPLQLKLDLDFSDSDRTVSSMPSQVPLPDPTTVLQGLGTVA